MKIIGTGLSGLVGSRVIQLLSPQYEFEDISRKTGTDITNKDAVLNRLQQSDAGYVIHMAAYTNVDGAEEQESLGENSEAWKINVVGTENVVWAAEATGKKLIFISTDFVFDGKNTPVGGYTEEDTPNPVNWYATTKYEAEKVVMQSKTQWLILRIAYPYRASFEKNDFMRAIKARLENTQEVRAVTDHIFCPTFIDDIAESLDALIKHSASGIYHVVGSPITPFESAKLIAREFNLDENLIHPTTRAEYFANKAERPFDLTLNNGKIKSLGVSLRSFTEGLAAIKQQLG